MDVTLPIGIIPDLRQAGMYIPRDENADTLSKRTVTFDLATMEESDINRLYKVLTQDPWKADTRTIRSSINAFKTMRTDERGKGATFRELTDEIRKYLVDGAIEGWMFQMTDEPTAALVTDVEFHPAVKTRDGVIPAYITIDLQQNDRGKLKSFKITIDENREGQSPGSILASKGWQKETSELHELYNEQLERYKEIRPLFGKQLQMMASKMWKKESRRRWSYYDRDEDESDVQQDLSKVGGGRLVHNDRIDEGVFSVSSRARYNDPDNPTIDAKLAAEIQKQLGKETKAFARSPYTMLTRVFHLGVHENFDVHVMNLKVYEYDKSMRAKLVLPEMYGEVLDVLTTDMKLIQEDIVQGKTGGNVVLLAGPPGTGKTLTSEVYAEFREVPLYKIHSGQLGTTPESIEKKLVEVYKRADDWGCPILLDEFDVFGKQRGDNLVQNAVVAVFLRTLEYQNNTIFLTTNRSDDMDDAILSRCSAIVNYSYPEAKELAEIWKVQRAQLLPTVTDETIDQLMAYFTEHNKQMSGRNVKSTLQLAARWVAAKNREPDVELLKTAASFRGI